jgi:hypothetical protein
MHRWCAILLAKLDTTTTYATNLFNVHPHKKKEKTLIDHDD